VEQILDDNQVQAVVNFAAPPLLQHMLLMRVEDGMCMASVGGNEGEYPCRDPDKRSADDCIQFAKEVMIFFCQRSFVGGFLAVRPWLLLSAIPDIGQHVL
jgi:hypothetical protein